jgi:pullulanase
MTQLLATAGLFALLSGAASLAQAAILPDSCDSPNFQIVQSPAGAAFDARAVWLDKRLVRWPGAAVDGVFRLYHSPRGSIAAPTGGKVSGAARPAPSCWRRAVQRSRPPWRRASSTWPVARCCR